MNIKEIIEKLNSDVSKPRLVGAIEIERRRKLDSNRDTVSVVVYTPRQMTLNGGDGHNGIDGVDMQRINDAIYVSLEFDGGLECVDDIVVRPMPRASRGLQEGII